MSDNSKPSLEARLLTRDGEDTTSSDTIKIGEITFATSEEVKTSLKEASRKTEVWTLSERLNNIEKMIPLPKLTSSNSNHWYECVKRLILLTDTSCVFLPSFAVTKATTMWSAWWASKLKEAAPHIKSADQDPPRVILKIIVTQTQAGLRANLMTITHKFWTFQPSKNMSLQSFIKEYLKRLNELKENCSISTNTKLHMKYLLLFHIGSLNPDLANRCRSSSFEDVLNECLQFISTAKIKSSTSIAKTTKCNYYGIFGHLEPECRKKKRMEKEKVENKSKVSNKSNVNDKILSVNNPHNSSYQLDTAADCHVSGNLSDFSDYSNFPKIVQVAGGGQITAAGRGTLALQSIDNQIDNLHGAIYIPGQRQCILSTAQLEKQGFSIRWPSNYHDIELFRPNGSICAVFKRISGRLLYKPIPSVLEKSSVYSINRNWHNILGHPGQHAQRIMLKSASINKYKSHSDYEICIKTKITKCKGHGSLRTASSFGENIHMDLVGGQKYLLPTTIDKTVPNATWFLLAIDKFTSWKWAWPIYSKKTVPTQIRYLLEHLLTKFEVTPKCLHTDSGTEFANSDLQEILLCRGIEWQKSSSHASEQNGVAERNVRAVTEKMRALHLQSGLPLKLWPIILKASINILNITPNSVAPKSPYFAVFHKMPVIQHLRPFGCRAFWLDPDHNKLNSKANEGIYVGSEFTNSHIILNPNTDRTIVRRDVRFQENYFPLKFQVLLLHNHNRSIIDTALSGLKAMEWNKAIDNEIQNMIQNNVWTLAPKSEANGKIMTGKWILKEKPNGLLKARWCARGFSEPFADDTYANVLPPTTMRMLLAYAATHKLYIRHVDITAAFLHADIDRPIYIEQPHTREQPGNLVCKLNKSIYGLKTAPRKWQLKLRQVLSNLGFQPLKYDTNVFRRDQTIISTYVDDFMILSVSIKQINHAVTALAEAFRLKDLGNMTKFLGINIIDNFDGIRINQEDKIEALCNEMGKVHCKGANTPISDDNLIDRDTEIVCTKSESSLYRSAVGSLLHIVNMTRPDIQYAVNKLCRHIKSPSENAFKSLKHFVRYVSRTKSASLFFPKSNTSELTASSDSTWGNTTSSKGASGNLFLINGTPIAWLSKKQSLTAQSTCEAEYAALNTLAVSAQWIRPLYNKLFQKNDTPIITEIDNTSAMITANSNKISARIRHFLMRQSTVRESIENHLIKLKYTPSDLCKADGLTKSLNRLKHTSFCNQINLELKYSVSGGCRDICTSHMIRLTYYM